MVKRFARRGLSSRPIIGEHRYRSRNLSVSQSVIGLGLLMVGCASPPTRYPASDSGDSDSELSQKSKAKKHQKPIGFRKSKSKFRSLEITEQEVARAKTVQPIVLRAANKYGIDANVLNAIIMHESRFNARARNSSGAKGLMQLMPKTSRAMAKRLGRSNRPMNPDFSIHAGAALLSVLLNKFDGNLRLALFGYARGSGSVRAWMKQRGPMPASVRKFIDKIRRGQRTFAKLGFASH